MFQMSSQSSQRQHGRSVMAMFSDINSYISLLLCCSNKTWTKSNSGGKRFIWPHRLQFTTKGSQSRNSRQEPRDRCWGWDHRGTLFSGLLLRSLMALLRRDVYLWLWSKTVLLKGRLITPKDTTMILVRITGDLNHRRGGCQRQVAIRWYNQILCCFEQECPPLGLYIWQGSYLTTF